MKKIKIKFIGFAADFDPNNNLIINALRKNFDVVFDDSPEYLFASVFGDPYEYVKYDCIRIFFSGENFSPDLNAVDYAIGFDPMVYADRFLRFPIYYFDETAKLLDKKDIEPEDKKRDIFCSFVFGHHSDNGVREEIFHKLNDYKYVASAGRFENNMPDGYICGDYEKKKELLRRSKFNICCESTNLNGFTTEKILHALACNTVPIYFGNENVSDDFNKDSFIDLRDFQNIDELVDYIKKVDNDDELYNSYLNKRKYALENQYEIELEKLEQFLYHICNQKYENAYRRPRCFMPSGHEKHLLLINYIWKYKPNKFFHNAYKIVKKFERKK